MHQVVGGFWDAAGRHDAGTTAWCCAYILRFSLGPCPQGLGAHAAGARACRPRPAPARALTAPRPLPLPPHRCVEPELAQVQLPSLQRHAEGVQLLLELRGVGKLSQRLGVPAGPRSRDEGMKHKKNVVQVAVAVWGACIGEIWTMGHAASK